MVEASLRISLMTEAGVSDDSPRQLKEIKQRFWSSSASSSGWKTGVLWRVWRDDRGICPQTDTINFPGGKFASRYSETTSWCVKIYISIFE
jgi:hypothetical protein